MKKRRPTSLN